MPHVAELFPGLKRDFRITSPPDVRYNCLSWAVGINDRYWDPAPGYYWPDGTPRAYSVNALILAYESLGFSKCENAHLEAGFEKVALYGDRVGYTHAARQLPNGEWASKLGELQDIEHATLEGLEGTEYGGVIQILRRNLTQKAFD